MGMIEMVRSVSALQGARVFPSRLVGSPQQALAVDEDQMVLLDETAPPALRVLSLTNGRVLRQIGSRGHAPGSFLGPRSLTRRADDPDGVWAFDSVLNRLTRFDIYGPPDRTRARLPAGDMVMLQGVQSAQQAEWSGETIVATGAFAEGRLARFDRSGVLLQQMGEIPGAPTGDVSIRQAAYQSVLRVHPYGELFVLATRRADRMDVLGADGMVLASAPRLQEFEPVYQVDRTFGRPVTLFDEHSRTGYIDVVVSVSRIFALYGGRRPLECGRSASTGRLVLEFGWDLHLKRALELDCDAVALGLSPDGTHLYTVVRDPGPGLLRHELAEESPKARVLRFPAAQVV